MVSTVAALAVATTVVIIESFMVEDDIKTIGLGGDDRIYRCARMIGVGSSKFLYSFVETHTHFV